MRLGLKLVAVVSTHLHTNNTQNNTMKQIYSYQKARRYILQIFNLDIHRCVDLKPAVFGGRFEAQFWFLK